MPTMSAMGTRPRSRSTGSRPAADGRRSPAANKEITGTDALTVEELAVRTGISGDEARGLVDPPGHRQRRYRTKKPGKRRNLGAFDNREAAEKHEGRTKRVFVTVAPKVVARGSAKMPRAEIAAKSKIIGTEDIGRFPKRQHP